MKLVGVVRGFILLLVASALVAGCAGNRPEAAAPPTAGAVSAPTSTPEVRLLATDTPIPTLSVEGGGILTDEPTSVPLPATVRPVTREAADTPTSEPVIEPSSTPAPTFTPTLEPATPTAAVDVPADSAPEAALPEATVPVSMTAFSTDPHPLQIEVMRQQSYPGSPITVEQMLDPGANYSRYIVSYLSEGYRIYALMTVPVGEKPASGWPVIIFNHGYIPPAQYRTTERYVAYVDSIARSGYIVFRSDYRGHGSSEGEAEGGYGSPAYTVDVLNAVAAMKAHPDADPNRIGMWGHSLGGHLTLRAMVVSSDIKAGVIWGGVVGPYPDLFQRGDDPNRPTPTPRPEFSRRRWRQELIAKYGLPEENPGFWASISPTSYLTDLAGPIQLHHSTTDEDVPVASSQYLYDQMTAAGMPVELYTYPGDNHNINGNFATAMGRSVAFFDQYVKGQ